MPEIRALSASMINKIAAGEVIERPASVVKELVENAIDAGSSRIEIEVEKSGFDLIRIVDNGCGISKDQLRLALSPHATSKISESDDLFKIKTLGFRGEALASIAEVCHLVVQSRVPDSPEGAQIESNGGVFSEPVPCGMAPGTIMSVRNIFFNVPARRKFLKSPTTEFGHISDAVYRLVLPNTETAFLFRHNGRIIQDLPKTSKPLDRIGKLFGDEVAQKMIYVESFRGDIHIHGYVGHPDLSRNNYNLQYFFLNRRFIRDRSLQHALTEAYRGLLPVGRYPVAFLEIDVPPDFVDVNVHPTKMEVRFLNASAIYSGFLGAIREEFLRSDLTSRPGSSPDDSSENTGKESFNTPPSAGSSIPPYSQDSTPQKAIDGKAMENIRSKVLSWSKGGSPPGSSAFPESSVLPIDRNPSRSYPGPSSPSVPMKRDSSGIPGFIPFPSDREPSGLRLHRLEHPASPGKTLIPEKPGMSDSAISENTDSENSGQISVNSSRGSDLPLIAYDRLGKPVIQIRQRYLVKETEDGLAIIDQHALHERILYEKIRKMMDQGELDSQLLLVPEAVDLSPTEAAMVLENKEIFFELGLQIGEFGGNTIIINGYPAILNHVPPAEILFTLLAVLQDGNRKPGRADLLDSMMHQMACKAAIKAGNRLDPDTISGLLELADQEIQSHHCPHGRPSTLVYTCAELDKLFKRT
ncbi:MAG: DNA mismatch repair endonuclease MutL [Planctomycetia bacterium]|nr:DNA mismatch repair endonuclease MutL [Planctomycetia bacterium]